MFTARKLGLRCRLLISADEEDPEAKYKNKPRGEKHFAFGKERPEETRAKISKALMGREDSEQTKLKKKRGIALARFPNLTPEDQEKLVQYVTPSPKEEHYAQYKGIRGPARLIASGLGHIIAGTWANVNEKYWRGARVWLYCKSGIPADFLRANFPVLTNLEESMYGKLKL